MRSLCIVFVLLVWLTVQQISQSYNDAGLNQQQLVAGIQDPLVGNASIINTSSLEYLCANTPYWNLNLCGISCASCQSGSSSCNSCNSSFTLSNGNCLINQSYGYYQSYCTTNIFDISSIKQFSFSVDYLSYDNVVTFCIPNTYQFQMLGLFSQRDTIYFSSSYAQTVTDVKIRLQFFSRFPNVNIVIIVNNEQMYSYTFTQLVALNTTYQLSTDANSPNFIQVNALNSLSASNLIHVIDTGFYTLQSSSSYDFAIQVTYLDDQVSNQVFWALRDFSVTAERCPNCVTSYVKSLGTRVGIAIGITFGVLAFLVFVLYMSILYQRHIRFSQMKSQNNSQQLKKQAKQNFNRISSLAITDSKHIIPIDSSKLMQIEQEQENADVSLSRNNNKNNVSQNMRNYKDL